MAEEAVDPRLVLDRRWLRIGHGPIGPEFPTLLQALALWPTTFTSNFHGCVSRVGSSHINCSERSGLS